MPWCFFIWSQKEFCWKAFIRGNELCGAAVPEGSYICSLQSSASAISSRDHSRSRMQWDWPFRWMDLRLASIDLLWFTMRRVSEVKIYGIFWCYYSIICTFFYRHYSVLKLAWNNTQNWSGQHQTDAQFAKLVNVDCIFHGKPIRSIYIRCEYIMMVYNVIWPNILPSCSVKIKPTW